ncbi:hypothetical protein GCM10009672_08630 [Nesterenkonia lutea]
MELFFPERLVAEFFPERLAELFFAGRVAVELRRAGVEAVVLVAAARPPDVVRDPLAAVPVRAAVVRDFPDEVRGSPDEVREVEGRRVAVFFFAAGEGGLAGLFRAWLFLGVLTA